MPRTWLIRFLFVLCLAALIFEGFRWYRFASDLSYGRQSLSSLRGYLALSGLKSSQDQVLAIQGRLEHASPRLARARSFADQDPLLQFASVLPIVGRQAKGLRGLTRAADDSARTGLPAADVLLDYTRLVPNPDVTSIQQGFSFLKNEETKMSQVESGLQRVQTDRSRVPGGLLGPLASAAAQLDDGIAKLDGLVSGYKRADAFLPELLGYAGPKSYLVLPENDTELFPSGGLISSYGVADFDNGRLGQMTFEYFVNLYDRWQELSHGEYVEPPAPLKQYLLRDVSWGLGEAGWYPDFPTTARLARSFADKGAVAPTDGTIAIDLHFVAGLLQLLGPVTIPEYGTQVTAENLYDVALAETRNEATVPGSPGKAFLSALAKALLQRLFQTSKDEWVDLLKLLDQMAKERHLQIYFNDAHLEELSKDYGLDGSIVSTPGDYLMLADTSVNSTKLNLILENHLDLTISLTAAGTASNSLVSQVYNPFPQWQLGHDPQLVYALMFKGVYGSFLRVYVQPQAKLTSLKLDGKDAGAEQMGLEVGKKVFGRFFPVLPGETQQVQFNYQTPSIVQRDGKTFHYQLYIQKEAGTKAIPLQIHVAIPARAHLQTVLLDGKGVGKRDQLDVTTDLGVDRRLDIYYSQP